MPVESKKLGRPPKLTPKVVYDLLRALAAGAYRKGACRYAGVGRRTLQTWLRIGLHDPRRVAFRPCRGPISLDTEQPIWDYREPFTFGEFRHKVQEAETGAGIRALAHLQRHMAKNWRPAAWFLERKFPEEWARREVVTATATALPGMPPGARVATPKGSYRLTLEVDRVGGDDATDPSAEPTADDS